MAEKVVLRFGQKVRLLRERRKITTRALASEIKVSKGSITEVEQGNVQPSIDFAYKIATFFGVSADVLLDDERDV
jgi:transcriptional regulator with XRE-family HTH domain